VQIALSPAAQPFGIVAGVDNAMWFVDRGTNTVGEISLTSHAVTTFPIPTPNAGSQEIVTGPDGSLWFTENASGKIGHIIP
jgi:virginiamycin B lyase